MVIVYYTDTLIKFLLIFRNGFWQKRFRLFYKFKAITMIETE